MNDVPMPEMVPSAEDRASTMRAKIVRTLIDDPEGYSRQRQHVIDTIEQAFRDGVLAERQRSAKTAAALDIATHAMQEAVSERLMSSGPLAAALAEMRRVLEDGER